jgi:hypothetical protein
MAPASTASAARASSDFGVQLRAKQKLKGYYGDITEKQFKRNYTEAIAHEGRRLAEPDRPARAPARHGRLPRQVRADDLGRAPVRQPRPHPGERREVQHRVAPGERRRRRRARPEGAGDGAGDRGAGPRRARHPRLRRSRRQHQGHLHPRAQARRGALSGADGAEPRDRILLALLPAAASKNGAARTMSDPPLFCQRPIVFSSSWPIFVSISLRVALSSS